MNKSIKKQPDKMNSSASLSLVSPSASPVHAAPLPDPPAHVPYAWPIASPEGRTPAKDRPRLCLVGEAPGADEVRIGQPFVGRSGQLLDRALANAGIDRKQCLIANVFRLQPPGNKVDHFFSSARRAAASGLALARDYGQFGSNWCLAAYAPELESLAAALKRFQPRVIVALGRTPLWALAGRNGIMTERGQELPCRLYPPAIVIPTFHPSYILRGNWGLEPQWTADLRQALERARG